MTERHELKTKALELSIRLFCGLPEERKQALYERAMIDNKDATVDEVVIVCANTFLKYISV